MNPNLQRLIQLAESTFDVKHDPDQLAVDATVLDRLGGIHPATMAEERTPDGPIAWTLVIPTTVPLMEAFLSGHLSERQMYEATPVKARYQSIYLCSAMVLPEHRRQGVARRMLSSSIQAIRGDHAISDLFFWPFSLEGEQLAVAVAQETGLPLNRRLGLTR